MARGSPIKKKGGYKKHAAVGMKGGRSAKLRAARKPKIPMAGLKFGGAAPGGGLMG